MHEFLSAKCSIEYLHIPLQSRRAFTQNEGKTNPALVTTQLSISASILISFEPHCGYKIPSNTEFWEPLHEENDSDIIIAV